MSKIMDTAYNVHGKIQQCFIVTAQYNTICIQNNVDKDKITSWTLNLWYKLHISLSELSYGVSIVSILKEK